MAVRVRRQLFLYLLSGGTAMLVHLAVLTGLVEWWALNPGLATGIGFCAGCVVNYLLQHRLAFEAGDAHRASFPRYVGVTAFTLSVNTLLFWLLHDRLALPYLLAQCAATVLVVGLNFQINRKFTFRVHGG